MDLGLIAVLMFLIGFVVTLCLKEHHLQTYLEVVLVLTLVFTALAVTTTLLL